ncbi:hypothetical protein Dsin_019673 [Dipteronia sinensis]|uniref:Uncharacterized protein n=1 Tax=Dipteronia sinensis TaxID=43782 RepID=A0AAE0A869_9ROSI|nr:hypothetical protein Dsin_019673 [Dipteronia sinensis]
MKISGVESDYVAIIAVIAASANVETLGLGTKGNVSLAERLTKYLVDLDSDGDSNYVLLANMYAAVGRWDGGGNIMRKTKGAWDTEEARNLFN